MEKVGLVGLRGVARRPIVPENVVSRTGESLPVLEIEHDNPVCLMTGPFIQLSYQVDGEVLQVGVGIISGPKQTTDIEICRSICA